MKYNWKRALINGGVIFLGGIIAKLEINTDSFWSLVFWQHTLISTVNVTFLAELRYIFAWLNSLDGNGGTKTNGTQNQINNNNPQH